METTTQIDLMPFCEPFPESGDSYDVGTPWKVGNFIYATDCKRIVRIPDDGRKIPKSKHNAKRPAAEKLFQVTPFPKNGWQPLPPLPDDVLENIIIGTVNAKCRECNGGQRECDMGHVHTCHKCSGTGKVVDSNEFKRQVVYPFWKIATECAIGKCQGVLAVFFRADGFEGIAMGLSNE